jgi:hypothetical protein
MDTGLQHADANRSYYSQVKNILYFVNLSLSPFMPFVAGSRLVLAALAFFPIVNAKDESLCEGHGRNLFASTHYVPTAVTSSVTYCAPPETLLIQQFDLAYFAKNSSILFNISAASVVSWFQFTATIPLTTKRLGIQCQCFRQHSTQCVRHAPLQFHH